MATTPSTQVGIIRAINDITDPNGNRVVSVDVQSLSGDLSIIPNVVIDSPLFAQYIPVIGQIVTIQRIGDYFTKVVGYCGSKAFTAPIQPGEVLMEGQGGGFMYLNNGGDVVVSDETLSNVMRILNMIGITMTADALSINIKGVGQLNITPQNSDLVTENKIEFIKMDVNNEPIARFTITDDKIAIDGSKVEIGLQTNALDTGAVVSQATVYGTHSFCPITGQPIPCAKDTRIKLDPITHTVLT